MNAKSLITAAIIAASAAGFSATQANADIDVGFGFNFAGPDFVISGGNHGYHGDYHYSNWGISCKEGRWEVKNAGFHKVKTKECNGKVFTYRGKQNGDYYEIKVSRKHGNIIDVNQIW